MMISATGMTRLKN